LESDKPIRIGKKVDQVRAGKIRSLADADQGAERDQSHVIVSVLESRKKMGKPW
jgi:hypothetical protein